jgi:hypothetical protein
MSKELTDQIAALQADKLALTTQVKNAGPDAVAVYKQAEAKRRIDIKAHADKYNKDGDLDSVVVEAIASDLTFEAFKDKVTDVIAKRTTSAPNKPEGNGGDAGDKSVLERYKASAPGSTERQKIVRDNRAEIRALVKSGKIV